MDIGQLLIIGFDGTEMNPALSSLLRRIQPAGVMLFARNIVGAEHYPVSMRDYELHMRMYKFLSAKYPNVKLSLHATE